MPPEAMFGDFLAGPRFALTGDQDWAPDWALDATLDVVAAENVPFHLFVTNESPVVRRAAGGCVTFGIHPNFLAGSTHGSTDDEVIDTCLELVPEAQSFRSHRFHENSTILRKLVTRGLIADSNLLAFLQPGLVPMIHGSGLIRFPVVLEDDVFLQRAQPDLDLSLALELLLAPGVKVLNFHPALVALNAPSISHYDAHREALYGHRTARCEPYGGRGAATILVELIRSVRDAGGTFVPFPALVTQAYESLRRTVPGGLYNWGV